MGKWDYKVFQTPFDARNFLNEATGDGRRAVETHVVFDARRLDYVVFYCNITIEEAP